MREKILVVDGRATVFRCDGQRGERSWLRLSLQLACSTSCYDAGMSQVVTQRELRNGSGEIMRRLDEGESFVVTRNGVPVGELTPLRRPRFVTADSITQLFQAAPPIDAEQFRRDLDSIVDQGIEPDA